MSTAAGDTPKILSKKQYEKELVRLQEELVRLQEWIVHAGLRVAVLFEGRDTAGKGGVIKRIAEKTNPRVVRTVALGTPTDREKTEWYFQRYVAQLPAAGEMVLFDRSWYNRAGVERVMGFATEAECREFLRAAPDFELERIPYEPVPVESIELPPRQERPYARPPIETQTFVPTRYLVE
jgi:polyphosphate kinase 2 (PPK2 family)